MYCRAETIKTLINLLASKILEKTFHVKELPTNEQVIYADNIESYNNMKKALIESNTQYFSYTIKSEKTNYSY